MIDFSNGKGKKTQLTRPRVMALKSEQEIAGDNGISLSKKGLSTKFKL